MPTEELYGAYNFLLEVSGKPLGRFQTVEVRPAPTPQAQQRGALFKGEVSSLEARSGAATATKIPGRLKWSDVTLKRGFTAQTASPHKIPALDGSSKIPSRGPAARSGIPGRLKWQPAGMKGPAHSGVGGVNRFAMGMEKTFGVKSQALQHKVRTGQSSLDATAVKRQPVSLILRGFQPDTRVAIAFPDVCKSGRIVLLSPQGAQIARWNFENAWPSKISGPSPKADSSEVGLEEFTIVVEYIERG